MQQILIAILVHSCFHLSQNLWRSPQKILDFTHKPRFLLSTSLRQTTLKNFFNRF